MHLSAVPRDPAPFNSAAFNKTCGFTMIELMLTIAIAGILAAIALPNLSATLRSNGIKSRAASLQADISYARNEAARRRATISMCPLGALADLVTGKFTCKASAADWTSGWLIYSGVQDASHQLTAAQVLKVRNDAVKIAITLASTDSIATNTFLALNQLGGAKQTGTFLICAADTTGKPGMSLRLTISGSMNSGVITCA